MGWQRTPLDSCISVTKRTNAHLVGVWDASEHPWTHVLVLPNEVTLTLSEYGMAANTPGLMY